MCPAPKGTTRKLLVVISGPTAVGKTRAAIELAEQLNTHILSSDSRQFYRELKIGSAMPAPEELFRIPHHFVGHLSVTDYYNVSRFEMDALKCLDGLFQQHEHGIMCGGSGLYIDAVCSGIDPLPDPDEGLRERLKTEFREQGIEALQSKLRQLDPEYYQQVDLKNHTRLMRAIEVCMLTGKPYSNLRTGQAQTRDFGIIKIGLELPKAKLTENIAKRTELMFVSGLAKEARKLFPLRHLNALKTVGYTELFEYFDGRYSLEEAREKIITNTWRYAKRQLTWFRKDKSIQWFHPAETDKIMKLILNGH